MFFKFGYFFIKQGEENCENGISNLSFLDDEGNPPKPLAPPPPYEANYPKEEVNTIDKGHHEPESKIEETQDTYTIKSQEEKHELTVPSIEEDSTNNLQAGEGLSSSGGAIPKRRINTETQNREKENSEPKTVENSNKSEYECDQPIFQTLNMNRHRTRL